ncbi:DUF3300 domain-containing protein [Dyella monticola]|uniref:DUF3300 domain-containing protein n=2 Tax=Dyella monticola TaxID=1927958 RepID=A0A370WSR8_9GAMM|nr:DUF3300 domain-containing protein [Dyella monticola]
MLVLAGCNQQPSQNQGSAPASSASAPASASSAQAQQQAYTPPTADQLYQLVAPIALFPDKLVAQVLAGSTYPDEVTAAQNLVAQNPNLKGDLLQAAVEPQSWDASVKGLTQFPSVLSQMAQNIQWTTALGQAYVNDPTDVLNAIQVMRQRARAQGNLQNSAQQAVTVQPAQAAQQSEQEAGYVANSDAPPVYSGPDVVPPPSQIIQIDPSQSGAVYVPSYDPQTVYGGEVPYYPSYQYEQPGYTTGEVVAVGAVAFGAAILVGSLMDHGNHGGGWHSWGMNWGGGYGGGGGGPHRPAVVYNNQTYVSRSTTVVNRYTTINNYNNRTANNVVNNRNQFNPNHAPAQPMNTPNFGHQGRPSAAAPHVLIPEQRVAQEARANTMHTPAPATQRPVSAPRPQETIRQPVPRPQSAVHAVPQAHPQPAFHATPQAQPRPAFHAAPQAHPQPAMHAAPQAHPAPRPAPAPQVHRPAPAPAPHAAPAQHAPQPHPAQQHPQNNGHQPPKKKDESHG